MKVFGSALLVFAAVGCGGALTDVDRDARDRWESVAPVSYRYLLTVSSAFCDDSTFEVVVTGDDITLDDGANSCEVPSGDASIASVFGDIEESRGEQLIDLDVVYDNEFGFPARVTATCERAEIDDCAWSVEITDFTTS